MMIVQMSVQASEKASVQASAVHTFTFTLRFVGWGSQQGIRSDNVAAATARQPRSFFDGTATTEHAAMARVVGPGVATRCG